MNIPSPSVQRAIRKQLRELLRLRERLALSDCELVAGALLIYFRGLGGLGWVNRWPEPRSGSPAPWWEELSLDWTEKERRSWSGWPTLAGWLGRSALRRVPLAVLRALGSWDAGTFCMQLVFHVPSPEQVLQVQVLGIRPVTLITDCDKLWLPYERFSNAFELTIHDLVHADRFQRDPQSMLDQIAFFRLLRDLVASVVLTPLLETDPELRHEFDYVLSDMNTSPLHGIQYLKAILIRHHLRRAGKSASEFMDQTERSAFERYFLSLIRLWAPDPAAEEALMRVCTPDYRPKVDGPRIHQMVLGYHQNRSNLSPSPER